MKKVFHKKHSGFSLGEALITLIVIGIVVALTAPSLMENYKKRRYEAVQKAFITNIKSAMRNMQVADKLSGYSTTEEFVNELRNYLKITKICDNSHLSSCFPSYVKMSDGENSTKISLDNFKTSESLGKEYSDDNIGIITINGTMVIVTYDPNCSVSGMNYKDDVLLSCLGMMYDLNGLKKPNSTTTDIRFLNAVMNVE